MDYPCMVKRSGVSGLLREKVSYVFAATKFGGIKKVSYFCVINYVFNNKWIWISLIKQVKWLLAAGCVC